MGPKDAAHYLAIASTITDHFNPLKSVEEGLDRAMKAGVRKGDKRNIEVVESDDEADASKPAKKKFKALPSPPFFGVEAAPAAAAGPRTLNIFNDSCKDINEYSVPLYWGVEEKAPEDSFFPGLPAIYVQMTERGPEEVLLFIGIHMLTLPQAIYADFKFSAQRAVLAVRYIRPSHKLNDMTKGSAQTLIEEMKIVKKRADATFRTGYTGIMLLPAAAFKCSLNALSHGLRCSTTDVIGRIVSICGDDVPRVQALAALRCGGDAQPFVVTQQGYVEPDEKTYPFMDEQPFDIALYKTFVHTDVLLPEDADKGETYDHVLDNFPVYLRTEGVAVHRKRWGKGRGMLFRNAVYDMDEDAHHAEVAIGMSNFFCAFTTGEGIENIAAMNAFIRNVEAIATPFKKACIRIAKGMRMTGALLHRQRIDLHYDVPKNIKPFLPLVTATPPESIDKEEVTENSVVSSSSSLEEEPVVPTKEDVIAEYKGVLYHRILRWKHLPSDVREWMGEDDSDFEEIISSDEGSVNADMEEIGIESKSWWRNKCNERGRKYEVLKKKRRQVWEARRLKHVKRFEDKKKALIPLYAATFIKPKELEKQDLDDEESWSPTSTFEVEYWERSMKKTARARERVADLAQIDATVAMAEDEAMDEASRGTPPATDSRGSVAATVMAD